MHYVMADLHGESSRYHAILTQTGFSSGDRLIVLGDVVDRGGIGGVDILLDLMERPNAVLLLGNHESMCLKAMDHPTDERAVNHWMRNGGQVTYNALQSLDKEDRERVLNYLHTLPDHLEIAAVGRRFYLVHGFPADSTYNRVWARPGPEAVSPFQDGTVVVAGHTPVCELYWPSGEPAWELEDGHLHIFRSQGYFDLDCACGYPIPQRRLACLRLEDLAEFYA